MKFSEHEYRYEPQSPEAETLRGRKVAGTSKLAAIFENHHMNNRSQYLINPSRNTFVLTIICILSICFNVHAQNEKDNIESDINNLFFNLHVDSCQRKIVEQIKSNKFYRFNYTGEVDTFGHGEYKFIRERNVFDTRYKLDNNSQALISCDSTLLQVFPVIMSRGQTHGKIDYENLYGHTISAIMFFADSIKAVASYRFLVDSFAKKLNRPFTSGDYTVKDIVKGNTTYINIDKKNNKYEYERNISISINYYEKLFILVVNYEYLTIYPEICNN